MARHDADHTNTFRDLIGGATPPGEPFQNDEFGDWHRRWQARLGRNGKAEEDAWALMGRHNPAVIPRNHQVEAALSAAVRDGDLAPVEGAAGGAGRPPTGTGGRTTRTGSRRRRTNRCYAPSAAPD